MSQLNVFLHCFWSTGIISRIIKIYKTANEHLTRYRAQTGLTTILSKSKSNSILMKKPTLYVKMLIKTNKHTNWINFQINAGGYLEFFTLLCFALRLVQSIRANQSYSKLKSIATWSLAFSPAKSLFVYTSTSHWLLWYFLILWLADVVTLGFFPENQSRCTLKGDTQTTVLYYMLFHVIFYVSFRKIL